MARIIAICNQKGGVGKTTTAINLGAYLAALGKKVLVVDFDPQANASSGLGVSPRFLKESVYHALFGYVEDHKVIKQVAINNLHLMPASPDLAGALVELIEIPDREYVLKKLLNRVRHNYNYILIDLPPSLSLLTVNGLVAADEVLIPIQAEYYSLEGLGQLLETIELINKNLLTSIKITGAVLTMFNKRETLSRDVAREVRRHFPHYVFEIEIPRAISLAESPSFSKPVILYDPGSPGARAYELLARELIKQEEPFNSLLNTGFGSVNL
ncbi:MAG TPA: AAA family ATPase [Candidatus Paceibacterota bacterium]|nr:AAA family ATPase [Candidatus Paceibacterota bacterium]